MFISLHSPYIEPGDLSNNFSSHLDLINNSNSDIHIFPELSLTGYNCGDLFFNNNYINEAFENIKKIHEICIKKKILAIVGSPLALNGSLYNCAVIVGLPKIIARAKVELCSANEYYEDRWFKSGISLPSNKEIICSGIDFQISSSYEPLNLRINDQFISIGIEICEDAWGEISPSMLFDNVDCIVNLSASSDTIAARELRKNMIKGISTRKRIPYLYVSGSSGESSSISLLRNIHIIYDMSICYEKYESIGKTLTSKIFIDFDFLKARIRQSGKKSNRLLNYLFTDRKEFKDRNNNIYKFAPNIQKSEYDLKLPNFCKKPFHNELSERNQHLSEVFDIQVEALKKRLRHTNSHIAVIGLSGGIDSAYSLMVLKEACNDIKTEPLALIMPSLGSSNESQQLASQLANDLKINSEIIDISKLSEDAKDIISINTSIAKENIQARLRTTVLMTLANDKNGIMVGTGTMSELAIGWCTYNADNMSMYNPNGGLPKTVLVDIARNISKDKPYEKVINEILSRPFTPELEIPNEDNYIKTTEERIGLYSVIDFCLFYTVNYGIGREEAKIISKDLFNELPIDILEFSIDNFYDRFIPSQFKRTIVPDSPKIFSFDLSPRGCFRVPSDIKNPF